MINAETLLGNGYRRSDHRLNEACNTLYQKKVVDARGTRYFIDIHEYDWSVYPQRIGPRFSYEPQVRFYEGDGETAVNMTVMLDRVKTVEDLEAYVDSMWKRMEFGYYELVSYTE